MPNALQSLYDRLASLTLGLWLLVGVMLLLACGSFLQAEGSAINDVALFAWLRQAPLRESWWLWGALLLLALLALNTLLCSIDSLRHKWQRGSFLLRIAPQLMHLGFLCIMVAHLQSAVGSGKQAGQVQEGSVIGLPDGTSVVFTGFSASYSPMGMPTAFGATLEHLAGERKTAVRISPNHPYFHAGIGIYLKEALPSPGGAALVELHREPGAGAALAGSVIFTLANLILLAKRRERTS